MAASLFSLSLLSLSLLIPLACSTSRQALQHHPNLHKGFRVSLKHVDSGKNLTKFERIQRGIKRGQQRLERLNAMVLADAADSTSSSVSAPLIAGNGEFLITLAIGSPPATYSAIVDTGSDLIWTQCKPCRNCFDQPTPIFDPKASSSFSQVPCKSQLCAALPASSCDDGGCQYAYEYGDYSSTTGYLAYETFTFDDGVCVPKIGFGCGEDNEGSGFGQGSGLVGLGRGPLSLVSQLNEPIFSYCLTAIDDTKTSTLLMGSLARSNTTTSTASKAIKTTPLIRNPSLPSFYYLSLKAISVAGKPVYEADESTFALQDDGSGGLIIDSGTTITYLQNTAYGNVRDAIAAHIKLPQDTSGATGLDLCYTLPSGKTEVEVPKLVFHFANNADLELPGENYMIVDSSTGLLCFAMAGVMGMSIFGNIQQQNMLITYDLVKETLSFVPTKCDQL